MATASVLGLEASGDEIIRRLARRCSGPALPAADRQDVIREASEAIVIVTETERLKIREFESHDVQALSKILSDPDVMKFSSKGPLNEADTMGFIEWCIKSYQKYGYGQWAVIEKESGKLIGCCGLSRATVDEVDEVEIGYRLDKEHWGKGLASEAASVVLALGFGTRIIESIVGIVAPRHGGSIRVLEKIGFRSFVETCHCGWEVRIYRLSQNDHKSYNTALQPTSGRDAAFRG